MAATNHRRPRAGGDPVASWERHWVPAGAGTTMCVWRAQWLVEVSAKP